MVVDLSFHFEVTAVVQEAKRLHAGYFNVNLWASFCHSSIALVLRISAWQVTNLPKMPTGQ